jgi:hypothetical protein
MSVSDRTYVGLTVLALTENGVRCAAAVGEAFWLPKNGVKWHEPLKTGQKVCATIPGWLAEKHPRLVGDKADTAREIAKPLEPAPSGARDMAGALFRNPRKEKDSQPDYNGDVTIGGVKYRLAGWLKESKSGKKFLSLAASEEKSA